VKILGQMPLKTSPEVTQIALSAKIATECHQFANFAIEVQQHISRRLKPAKYHCSKCVAHSKTTVTGKSYYIKSSQKTQPVAC